MADRPRANWHLRQAVALYTGFGPPAADESGVLLVEL
jgi:hypothetical protein